MNEHKKDEKRRAEIFRTYIYKAEEYKTKHGVEPNTITMSAEDYEIFNSGIIPYPELNILAEEFKNKDIGIIRGIEVFVCPDDNIKEMFVEYRMS